MECYVCIAGITLEFTLGCFYCRRFKLISPLGTCVDTALYQEYIETYSRLKSYNER